MSVPATVLDVQMREVFGDDDDSIEEVETRARQVYPYRKLIVWEGNPETFAFTYVGGDAEALLGHPSRHWVTNPTFWADHIIHPDDRDDAVAYCALATCRVADHVFEYRAITTGQDIRWLRDYVRVVVGPRRIPILLRGLMFDVTEEKMLAKAMERQSALRLPAPEDLREAA